MTLKQKKNKFNKIVCEFTNACNELKTIDTFTYYEGQQHIIDNKLHKYDTDFIMYDETFNDEPIFAVGMYYCLKFDTKMAKLFNTNIHEIHDILYGKLGCTQHDIQLNDFKKFTKYL